MKEELNKLREELQVKKQEIDIILNAIKYCRDQCKHEEIIDNCCSTCGLIIRGLYTCG